MGNENHSAKVTKLPGWGIMLLDLPWIDILTELWKIGRKAMRGMANEGVYETLDYESTLEIHNTKGTRATYNKRKKIRYLQDNIIAYQDYGWGDGEILLIYRSSRGLATTARSPGSPFTPGGGETFREWKSPTM